jgi:hypothetical protein
MGAAFPDPPSDVPGEPPSGFDVDLEHLAVAVARGHARLADAIDRAQGRLSDRGLLATLGKRWFAADNRSMMVLA